mgnify:CR=1 FL=1
MQTEVGIRELKAQLSAYLRQVKAGGTVVITDRGKPIGRIVPLTEPVEAQLESLQEAGLIAWSGKKLSALAPVARTQGERTVADLLLEDRE